MTMPLARMAPQVRCAVELRQWVVQHIPLTQSAVGYDLFLAIADHLIAGDVMNLRGLGGALPHAQAAVRQQLHRLEQAGLVLLSGGPQPAEQKVVPTARFVVLLNDYAEQLERVYLVRQQLRARQLRVDMPDPALHELAVTLYDRFHDLGWLYLNAYGAICFLMARLVQNAAVAQGHRARVVSGYVQVDRGDGNVFLLGGRGVAAPGQIEGHAFCVVDEAMIVDFGLGNLRRGHMPGIAWGVACAYRPQPPVYGQVVLSDVIHAAWKGDWVYPGTEAEFAKFDALVDSLSRKYREHAGLPPANGAMGAAAGACAPAVPPVVPAGCAPAEAGLMNGSARRC